MTCNTFNNQTTKYSTAALTTTQLNAQLYNFEQLYNIQTDPSLLYDNEVIYSTVSLTKATLATIDPSGTIYPLVWERFNQSPILAPEYADFLNYSQYDLSVVNSFLNSFFVESSVAASAGLSTTSRPLTSFPIEITAYYEQLDLYYNDNFSASLSGGFCSTFSGKLLELATLASSAVNLINQLKNFSIDALAATVLAKLNSIKEILYNLVDSLKEKLLQQINNIVDKIVSFKNMIMSTAKAIGKKVAQAKNFFSDLNMKNIKTKIEELIAKMAGGYEKITPEVIAYIMFRLCKLVESVEAFMKSPVDGLKSVMEAYAIQAAVFGNFSTAATSAAVQAGHHRRDVFDLANERDAAIERSNSAGLGAYIRRLNTAEEIAMAMEIKAATTEQIYSESFAAARMITFTTLGDDSKDDGPGRWQNLDMNTLINIFRVSNKIGAKLSINSAWRSIKTQESLYARGKTTTNRGRHVYGQALDIRMRDKSTEFRDTFIRFASEELYGGIGTYPTFIHVDTGGLNTWGELNAAALREHENGTYRRAQYENITNSGPQ